MDMLKKVTVLITLLTTTLLVAACSPEVGSVEWCSELKEKPKGEWTANELADFTKHCLLP